MAHLSRIQSKCGPQPALPPLCSLTVRVSSRRFKVTWVPKDAVQFCLICGDRFKTFGRHTHRPPCGAPRELTASHSKSRVHCRYCGRVLCKACVPHEIPLPELGEPRVVCDGCSLRPGPRRLQHSCSRVHQLRPHEGRGGGGGQRCRRGRLSHSPARARPMR
jgi:hypothetical protein